MLECVGGPRDGDRLSEVAVVIVIKGNDEGAYQRAMFRTVQTNEDDTRIIDEECYHWVTTPE